MADTYARMRGSAPLRTRSLVRLWEKELMLSRFDALWGDFHQVSSPLKQQPRLAWQGLEAMALFYPELLRESWGLQQGASAGWWAHHACISLTHRPLCACPPPWLCLQDVTQLQASVALRAFSQLDPMDEFRLEAGELFAELLEGGHGRKACLLGGHEELAMRTGGLTKLRLPTAALGMTHQETPRCALLLLQTTGSTWCWLPSRRWTSCCWSTSLASGWQSPEPCPAQSRSHCQKTAAPVVL